MKIIFLIALLNGTLTYGFTLNSSSSSNFRGWEQSEIQFQMNLMAAPIQDQIAFLRVRRAIIDVSLQVILIENLCELLYPLG